MASFDILSAFRRIELELINSMARNLKKHRDWEKEEDINWTMWQAEQLKTMREFQKNNRKVFGREFNSINRQVENILKQTYQDSGFEEERRILEYIKGGKKLVSNSKGIEAGFFQMNERKMNTLIKSTTNDMKTAQRAMFRMTDDVYRKTIFDAQVYFNSGAGTLDKAIDMATKDFLNAGINCVEYSDGRRVNIATYSEMALRTANKRAMLESEGDKRREYGITTVKVSKYGACSDTCLPWQGRKYVDDVYSGGTKQEAVRLKLPLLSKAVDSGLFHPNCRHSVSSYFPGLEEYLDEGELEYPEPMQEHRRNQLHIQKFKRREQGSLDADNINAAKERKDGWIERDNKLLEEYPEILDLVESDQESIRGKIRRTAKSVFSDGDVVPFDKLPTSVQDNFNNQLQLSDIYVKKLLDKHMGSLDFLPSDKGSGAVFNKALRVVKVPINASPRTLAHEMLHAIDTKFGITVKSNFRKNLLKDYARLVNKSNGDVLSYLLDNYPTAFELKRGRWKLKEEYRGVSDIFSGVTNGSLRLGYGHRESYWEVSDSRLPREAWAQFGSDGFMNNHEVISMLMNEFPLFGNEALNILKGLVK